MHPKAFNQTPEARPLLRKRCGVERVPSHLMRYGLRAARYFGQARTQFQAYMTAAAYNPQRIATMLAARAAWLMLAVSACTLMVSAWVEVRLAPRLVAWLFA